MGRDDDIPRNDDVRGEGDVRSDRDVRPGRIERLDVIEFGGSPGGGRSWRPWRRWLSLALAAGVAAVVVAAVVERARDGSTAATPRPSATAVPGPGGPAVTASTAASAAAPGVSQIGHPLLGVTAGWELFGRGSTTVVRVELAGGRVTTTVVPPILSSGPSSFVVGRDWAMVRPLDQVPGYVVQDGRAAQPLHGPLENNGPAEPGPDGNSVWIPAAGSDTSVILVDAGGRPTGPSVSLPPGVLGTVTSDDAGYLVFVGNGGAYSARPDGLRRITTGQLMAAGPTRWLALECDDRYRCGAVVIDRRTGARRAVDVSPEQANISATTISPDGATAALIESGPNGSIRASLYSLASGSSRAIGAPVGTSFDLAAMVWSPDSRWLFVASADGSLYPVDAATGEVHSLGVTLPPITQLAVRPAPA